MSYQIPYEPEWIDIDNIHWNRIFTEVYKLDQDVLWNILDTKVGQMQKDVNIDFKDPNIYQVSNLTDDYKSYLESNYQGVNYVTLLTPIIKELDACYLGKVLTNKDFFYSLVKFIQEESDYDSEFFKRKLKEYSGFIRVAEIATVKYLNFLTNDIVSDFVDIQYSQDINNIRNYFGILINMINVKYNQGYVDRINYIYDTKTKIPLSEHDLLQKFQKIISLNNDEDYEDVQSEINELLVSPEFYSFIQNGLLLFGKIVGIDDNINLRFDTGRSKRILKGPNGLIYEIKNCHNSQFTSILPLIQETIKSYKEFNDRSRLWDKLNELMAINTKIYYIRDLESMAVLEDKNRVDQGHLNYRNNFSVMNYYLTKCQNYMLYPLEEDYRSNLSTLINRVLACFFNNYILSSFRHHDDNEPYVFNFILTHL